MYITVNKLEFPKPEGITIHYEDIIDPNNVNEHNIAIKVNERVVMILSEVEAETIVSKLGFILQIKGMK